MTRPIWQTPREGDSRWLQLGAARRYAKSLAFEDSTDPMLTTQPSTVCPVDAHFAHLAQRSQLRLVPGGVADDAAPVSARAQSAA